MHQARGISSDLEYGGNNIFLADMSLGDVFDLNAGIDSGRMGHCSNLVTQRLGKARVIKDADAFGVKKTGHALCVARTRQCTRYHNTVVAGQHPDQTIRVALCKVGSHHSPRRSFTQYPPCLVPATPA